MTNFGGPVSCQYSICKNQILPIYNKGALLCGCACCCVLIYL
nr:MAG TPA: hypothetical protein [Caudoviricetes sp.]DAK21976.1 MAG TPA: hypothetical protein [Caudoviricetes sp.]